ncbi:MAG: maleylacetoacetate isomerase [Motiliproteus sp.]|nr:maleylacetoacetate isomerase [Motiliproteus sp.]MCW9052688.1 maleylacetoacetate isomerase [Motiliproteus sp.]
MILYDYYRSSAAYRVRIALNLKALSYQQIAVNLLESEQQQKPHRARNPQGLVPVLEDQDTYLTQSLAICEYLDEAYPHTLQLLPTEPQQRARIRALAQLVACDIHPINNLRVLKYLKDHFGAASSDTTKWYQHWIIEGFQALEQLLANSDATGLYCHGDSPTLADICLVPQVFNANRFKVGLDQFPTISRIHSSLEALEPIAKAHPSQQPGA